MEVKEQYQVPNEPGNNNAGLFGVLVKCNNGYHAWGYGETKSQAKKNAKKRYNIFRRRSLNVGDKRKCQKAA
jgi:dsRNA-specific ribonuclease